MKVPKKALWKVERIRRRPLTVVKHHDDGTVTIQESPCVTDNANITQKVGTFL